MEVKELSAISSDEIISILKEEIKNYDVISRDQEVGTVISVGDGIASVYGIDHAMYGEIVTLETGLKGMVQDIKENEISCILFGDDSEIKQGTKVCRTGKKAGIPVGEGYIGRIVDALGAPIDGKGEIKADGYRPVENEAPGIVERKSVSVPLETGILSIDSMFPIGRGQRELIIGDRQTGKTSIATDTIINQKGKDVICIYVAIGQKASTVARLVNDLKAHDQTEAMTLGTRIVVMNAGIVQQVDTPQTLYDYPCNQFVAGFIGSPQMNFVDAKCKVVGNKVYLVAGPSEIELPPAKAKKLIDGGYEGKTVASPSAVCVLLSCGVESSTLLLRVLANTQLRHQVSS